MPPHAREAFDLIAARGTALAESALGQPALGVKCGCNDAFLMYAAGESGNLVEVRQGARSGLLDRASIRPALKGEHLTAWSARRNGSVILWTHGANGLPLERLPPAAERWLHPWKRQLLARAAVW